MKTNKEDVGIITTIILMALLFLLVAVIQTIKVANLSNDYDCYISHLKECFTCHNTGLTYSLCSGVCVEPREEDLEIFCAVHPTESCWDLPKEICL
jgi:hypothetical protein